MSIGRVDMRLQIELLLPGSVAGCKSRARQHNSRASATAHRPGYA